MSMTSESLRDQTEELWRETLREALLDALVDVDDMEEQSKLRRVLEAGIGLQIISREAANEIAAALGVG